MSKVRPSIGIDGLPLPILPPERDARVWARLVRVMFYTPGFLALLLIKAGEPTVPGDGQLPPQLGRRPGGDHLRALREGVILARLDFLGADD